MKLTNRVPYLQFCIDNVTAEKQIKSYPNNKPWMTREVKLCLRDRDSAFRSGNVELKRSIKEAKAAYRQKIEGHFSNGDPQRVWQCIQQLANNKSSTSPDNSSTSDSLAEEVNHFFTRFDVSTDETESVLLPSTDSLAPSVSTAEVRKVLRSVNPRKTAGPDGIPGRALRD